MQFATATQRVARLSEAKHQGTLEAELKRLSFIPVIVIDEVGYIPFDPEAANLMFSLVSNRYERASMIVTSNKPSSKWGEIFGDDMAATAMIDRLIHHSEILSLKGDSYRLRAKDLDTRIGAKPPKSPDRSPSDTPPRAAERRTRANPFAISSKATRSGPSAAAPAASRSARLRLATRDAATATQGGSLFNRRNPQVAGPSTIPAPRPARRRPAFPRLQGPPTCLLAARSARTCKRARLSLA